MMNTHAHLPTDTLLASFSDRVALIRQYANEAESADFASKWLDVLERCATWFSSMPLRPGEHAEAGGAFRATVEAAYFAMRLSGAQKFAADQTSERRRQLEPQYLYALFLAACCSRLDEPCRHFQFHRHSDGIEWIPAIHGAFGPWLGGGTYGVTRRETALPVERMRTALLAREILGAERLAGFDGQVLADLFGAINPEQRPSGLETLLHKVVRQAIDTVTQFEVKARRAAFAPDTTPAPKADLLSAAADATAQAKPPVTTATVPAAATAPASVNSHAPTDAPAQVAPPSPAQPAAPATAQAPRDARPSAVQLDGSRSLRPEQTADPFKEALAGASNLMREFFRALAQDVAAGKVKVSWVDDRLAISKRMLSNYGIASETLIENLRKFQLLYKIVGQDILLVDKVANLIATWPQSAGNEVDA
ncbi:conjugal transfer pilus assembly protein TraI [Cupriavidus alkaliphilus]|uniref:Conjugal transfer pilus assembly protein TraI n=2 Tax=Cupriavidus alkaliphilus TaxID=942866 RepID=A0A7W4VGJ7_9BURK|nr:conjugal transfer pilus assembly protein TraI [Cupriavidus alkaliphilus]